MGKAVAVAGLGVMAVASGRLFGLIELYVVGAGLILAVIMAVIHVRTRFVHVVISRDIDPPHPIVGSDLRVTLTLQPLRRTPTCELTDLVDDVGRVGLTLAPLKRRRTARVHYRVPTQRRGLLVLGPATIELADPLGLTSRRRQVGTPTDVVVHPRWSAIALPDPHTCEGPLITFIRQLVEQMAVNLEFRALREYVAGDDLRRINWKASARRDILTLNEFESRSPLVVHVLLDRDDSVYSEAGFERAVSIAASFVGSAESTASDTEPRVHLSVPPIFDAAIIGPARFDAMRTLAQLNGEAEPGLPTLLNDPGELRVNVIVCGDRAKDWLDSMDRSMGRGHATIVIHCDTPTRAPADHDHWFALCCLDFADFTDRWGDLSRRSVLQ